jgi:hypothetical protein
LLVSETVDVELFEEGFKKFFPSKATKPATKIITTAMMLANPNEIALSLLFNPGNKMQMCCGCI